MQIERLLDRAAEVAVADDLRNYRLGAVAVRQDGTIVSARNGSSTHKCPAAHAEARVLRKAGKFATIFVTRIDRNGEFALARPCADCRRALLWMSCRVVYTVGPGKWEVLT